jgi:hypothetical protein
MDVKCDEMAWIHLAQVRLHWFNGVISLRVLHIRGGIFILMYFDELGDSSFHKNYFSV